MEPCTSIVQLWALIRVEAQPFLHLNPSLGALGGLSAFLMHEIGTLKEGFF